MKGNVRELKNLVKRMVILLAGERISAEDVEKVLEAAKRRGAKVSEELTSLRDSERQHIVKALARARGVLGGSRAGPRHAVLHPPVPHPQAAHPTAGLPQVDGVRIAAEVKCPIDL